MSRYRTGLLCLFGSVVLLSSGWPLTKLAVDQGTTALWFAESRAVLSCLVTGTLLAISRGIRLPRRHDLPALFAIGIFQIGLFFVFSHLAITWIQAGRTAVLANTTTYYVVPLSMLVLRERIPPRRWLAAGLGVAGIGVLIGPWAIDWSSSSVLLGNAFLLLAGLAFAISIVTVRAIPPRAPMFELLPWCFLIGAALMLPLVLWEAPHGTLGTSASSWASILYVGLIAGPLGTWGIVEATIRLPTVVSSIGFLATPAVGLILANLMLGERLTPDLLGGSALILAGVGIAAIPGRAAAHG
ncbi:MAG: DMT family transporter [Acetobacteraceae bacterium]